MHKFVLTLLLICILGPRPAFAGLTVEGAIDLALETNRDLRIAAFQIDLAKSRSRWSGRLANPELEISATNDSIGLDDNEAVYEIAFAQKFPVTSRLKNEREVRRVQVLLAEAELAEQRRQLAFEVDQLATELLALQAKTARQQLLIELNEEITEFLKSRAAAGEVSSLDVTQALLNGRSLAREAAVLEARAKKLSLELNQMIGFDSGHKLDLEGDLSFPDSRPANGLAVDPILAKRPDHAAKLIQADVARAELALEDSKQWEDVAVKLFLEREHAVDDPSGLERNTFAGIGFSIPLPLRNRNEDGIEQAEIQIEIQDKTVEASEFAIRSEIEAALQARLSAWGLANQASGEILELAEKNLADFRRAYENGQASLLQVQRAQEQLLELQTARTDLERDYHLAEAALRFAAASYPNLNPTAKPESE